MAGHSLLDWPTKKIKGQPFGMPTQKLLRRLKTLSKPEADICTPLSEYPHFRMHALVQQQLLISKRIYMNLPAKFHEKLNSLRTG
jgi:hypothetical protein